MRFCCACIISIAQSTLIFEKSTVRSLTAGPDGVTSPSGYYDFRMSIYPSSVTVRKLRYNNNAYGLYKNITFTLLCKVFKPQGTLKEGDTYKTKIQIASKVNLENNWQSILTLCIFIWGNLTNRLPRDRLLNYLDIQTKRPSYLFPPWLTDVERVISQIVNLI